MEDSEFLANIKHELLTQDNLCTSDVFFLVQEKKRDYGYDPKYSDEGVWVDVGNDGIEVSEDDEDFNDLELTYVCYQDRWEYVQGFFTSKAAHQYIDTNSHRHRGELRVYGESLYRNPEMTKIRKILMK